jgi:hypothetical protein
MIGWCALEFKVLTFCAHICHSFQQSCIKWHSINKWASKYKSQTQATFLHMLFQKHSHQVIWHFYQIAEKSPPPQQTWREHNNECSYNLTRVTHKPVRPSPSTWIAVTSCYGYPLTHQLPTLSVEHVYYNSPEIWTNHSKKIYVVSFCHISRKQREALQIKWKIHISLMWCILVE